MFKRSGKILVVEDEVLIRFALCELLEEEGFTVFEAGDVLSALGFIGKYTDIIGVISDIDLPGALNGIDLINLVSRTLPSAKLIVTSGRSPEYCMGLPENAVYFQKPYNDTLIVALMHSHVQKMSDAGGQIRSA